MRNTILLPLLIPITTVALAACDDQPICHYGQVPVRVYDSAVGSDWACMSPASSSTAKPSPSSSSTGPSSPAPSTTVPSGSSTGTPTTDTPTTGDTCGGLTASSDNVRVVGKSDPAPTFDPGMPNLSDGTFSLVQATFYRSGTTDSSIRSLKASLQIQGQTVSLGAQDTSVAGQPNEALTFLVGADNVTKTCQADTGSIAAWFFPFTVGGTGEAHFKYDSAAGFLRMIVKRSDGTTELVFSR